MPSELPKSTREWIDKILTVNPATFEALAITAFEIQYHHNPIYAAFAKAVGKIPGKVTTLTNIPFLPVSFFKTHLVTTSQYNPSSCFESSGTTGMHNSRHAVKDIALYEASFLACFQQFYANPKDWCIIGLLPAYLERQHSSLVYMVNVLINKSNNPASGFYLYEFDMLNNLLQQQEAAGKKTLLLGVTFALLDFAEQYPQQLKHTIIMETGGMKGRREEWTRQQVHAFLQQKLGTNSIHSEYGMTELLSQGYSSGNGIFNTPSWLKILVRQDDDPLTVAAQGSGLINIIDLANIYSCCFIATDDVGTIQPNGSFEIAGRRDNSDLRGCSLLTA
jgi:hypothetical protein